MDLLIVLLIAFTLMGILVFLGMIAGDLKKVLAMQREQQTAARPPQHQSTQKEVSTHP